MGYIKPRVFFQIIYFIHRYLLTSRFNLSLIITNIRLTFKPIFHCDAKHLAWGVGVGQCPWRQNFALDIPTCYRTPNLKFALPPMPTPDASEWNIGGVGHSGIGAGIVIVLPVRKEIKSSYICVWLNILLKTHLNQWCCNTAYVNDISKK